MGLWKKIKKAVGKVVKPIAKIAGGALSAVTGGVAGVVIGGAAKLLGSIAGRHKEEATAQAIETVHEFQQQYPGASAQLQAGLIGPQLKSMLPWLALGAGVLLILTTRR